MAEQVELFVVQWKDEYDAKWRTDNTQPAIMDLHRAELKLPDTRAMDGVVDARIVRILGEVVPRG